MSTQPTQALTVVPAGELRRPALIEPNNVAELQQIGQLMATSGFFQDSRQAAQACVKILAGREMGIPPFASMVGISIIQGKPAVGANLLAAAMKRAGYSWRVLQQDATGCRLEVRHMGQVVGPSDFLQEDAKRADLLGKNTWKQYPKSMYFARAISNAARVYAPEIFAGVPAYTAEELGAENVTEDGGAGEQRNGPEAQQELAQRRIAEEQAKVEPELATPEQAFRTADRYGRLQMFQGLKARYKRVLVDKGEPHYYDVLQQFDVGKSDQFKNLKQAIECYLTMLKDVENLEAGARALSADPAPADAGTGPYEASDDDVAF